MNKVKNQAPFKKNPQITNPVHTALHYVKMET